jgi:hypothetical protein
MLRHETWQAALRTHAAEAERVYDEALNAERQVQARRQFEDMEARVAGDSGFTSLTFQGPLPLDPKYVQRAYEAANKARAKWLQKNPAPTPENVRI